jgi:hypothetical protein
MQRFTLFVSAMVVVDLVGLLVAGVLLTGLLQQVVFLLTLVLAPLVAYWVTYRGGLQTLGLGGRVD